MHVYEKIKPNIWTFNGVFRLVDAWREPSDGRKVFKFKLELLTIPTRSCGTASRPRPQPRDPLGGQARGLETRRRPVRHCGSTDNLHFDHVLPFSKGGSSLLAENVQLLCARHNLRKSASIQ